MGNVMVIPAKRQVGNNIKKAEKPKLRVAAYCRVSTDSDEQATSYDAQIEHYTEYISKNPEWVLAGIFADATCIIGTNQSPSKRAAICPYFFFLSTLEAAQR